MFGLFMAWMFIKFIIAVCIIVAIVAMVYMNGENKKVSTKVNDTKSSNHH